MGMGGRDFAGPRQPRSMSVIGILRQLTTVDAASASV